MRNLRKELENKNVLYEELVNYGFVKCKNSYVYETNLSDNNFKVVVEISKISQTSKVIDLSIDEEYALIDVKDIKGSFIGKLKEEYDNLIEDIIDKCTSPNVFKSKQAIEIIKYVKEKYGDDLEYLWKKFPNDAVWRNKENNKWYGALLVLSENKLGINSERIVDIIDLRYQKEKIKDIINNKDIFGGYHMNKNSWITIKLDDSVSLDRIFELIDNSYRLSLEK